MNGPNVKDGKEENELSNSFDSYTPSENLISDIILDTKDIDSESHAYDEINLTSNSTTDIQNKEDKVKVEKDTINVIKANTKPFLDVLIKIENQHTRGKAKKINRRSTESPNNKGQFKKNVAQRSKNIEDKKTIKKHKHKKYEKPSDPILKFYQCSQCPKVFQRSSNFKAHQQRTHNPLRPFSCQDCKNSFHYRSQLRDHARIHTGERPFKCHSCSKTFARKGCLVAHMVIHSDALPFQCDICCRRFARKYNLAKHIQSHSGERPYRCLNCSRRFKCKQSLDKHHRIHQLNIYACVICHESFDSKRHLTHHQINEHVSYRPFTCQICHKPFIFKSQLTYHIKEHNLERPYSCGKCNKSYFKKGHLLSHIKQYCSDFVPVPQVKEEVPT